MMKKVNLSLKTRVVTTVFLSISLFCANYIHSKPSFEYTLVTASDGSKSLSIVKCKNAEQKIFIPANDIFEGVNYPVKHIGANAFKGDQTIKQIIFPASIETIGPCAFQKCDNLEVIDCSADIALSSIGEKAFDSCQQIEGLSIKSTKNLQLSNESFANCSNLQSALIECGLSENTNFADMIVGSKVFNNCPALVAATFKVNKNGKNDRYSILNCNGSINFCSSLESLHFDVDEIEFKQYVAINAGKLQNIYIPAHFTEHYNPEASYAFRNCGKIEHIYLSGEKPLPNYDTKVIDELQCPRITLHYPATWDSGLPAPWDNFSNTVTYANDKCGNLTTTSNKPMITQNDIQSTAMKNVPVTIHFNNRTFSKQVLNSK